MGVLAFRERPVPNNTLSFNKINGIHIAKGYLNGKHLLVADGKTKLHYQMDIYVLQFQVPTN